MIVPNVWFTGGMVLLLGLLAGPAGASEAGANGTGGGGAGRGGTAGGAAQLDSLYARYRPLLRQELVARRLGHPDDLYKLLFQAEMGPAHAVSDTMALDWLVHEWEELPARQPAGLPLLEPLRPDSQLVRVHLMALRELVTAELPPPARSRAQAVARQRLALAFARTAAAWQPDLVALRGIWQRLSDDPGLWSDHFTAGALQEFTHSIEIAGWPAVHHSADYEQRWRPHYRVVAPAFLPPAWLAAAGWPVAEQDSAAGGGGRP
jgi:hypothetical protein